MKRVPFTRRSGFHRLFNALKTFIVAVAGLSAGIFQSTIAARAEGWPAHVKADYDITFNGFSVGTFAFQAETGGQVYTASGNAKLSLLLGAISLIAAYGFTLVLSSEVWHILVANILIGAGIGFGYASMPMLIMRSDMSP